VSERAAVLAPAKVNLALRVLHARADGYHELDTLFQAVELYDRVEVEPSDGGVSLEVEGPDLGPVEANLAHRAAACFLEVAGAAAGVRVRLAKRIPVGAGLGGGSSDAAAVLRCMATLFGSVGAGPIREIAAELGSDVPFFLGVSSLARGRGRGEILQALTPLPARPLVLVSPPVHVSTAEAYRALDESRNGKDPAPSTSSARPSSWAGLSAVAVNDFEPVMAAAHPEIALALVALRDAGASTALMTGSGSTCFGLFAGELAAERAAAELRDETTWPCVAVRTLESFPEVVSGRS
jgi:4-diphosphocytidyl-2-C-methyl-D-erythritol kinase